MKNQIRTTLAVLLFAALPALSQINASWTGAADQLWNEPLNWTSLLAPCNALDTYNANIGGGAGTITLPVNCTIQSLDMQLGATISINNGVFLTIRESALNGGIISPNSSGTPTGLSISDSSGDLKVALTGQGEMLLDHDLDLITGTNGHTLIHDGSHTIHGFGQVGGFQINIENSGSIVADSFGNTLQLQPRSTFLQDGNLTATNGGILELNVGTYTAHPSLSHIKVEDNSEIQLNGCTIDGGSFEVGNLDATLNNNIVRTVTNSTLKGTTNEALLVVDNSRTLSFVGGDITNLGLILLEGTTAASNLSFSDISDSTIALGGTGSIVLDSAFDGITGTNNHTLVHNAPHTIQGGGNLGQSQLNFVNHSSVTANQPLPLSISPRSTWDNDGGTIIATPGATAILNAGAYSCQNGGFFQVGDAAELRLVSPSFTNSTFHVDNADFDLSNNLLHVTSNSAFNNCINNATLRVDNARTLSLITGDFTNNAPVHLDGSTSATNLCFSDVSDSEVQLLGTGTVFLDNGFDTISGTNNHTIRHGLNHTIEGFGSLGVSQIQVINHGAIEANVNGETLVVSPRNTFHNDGGTLRASNGATLRLNAGAYTVANGGSYLIGDDCLAELNSVTLKDLTLDIEDLDLNPLNNDAIVLTNSTFNGVVNKMGSVLAF